VLADALDFIDQCLEHGGFSLDDTNVALLILKSSDSRQNCRWDWMAISWRPCKKKEHSLWVDWIFNAGRDKPGCKAAVDKMAALFFGSPR
jgi:hypothetical protein